MDSLVRVVSAIRILSEKHWVVKRNSLMSHTKIIQKHKTDMLLLPIWIVQFKLQQLIFLILFFLCMHLFPLIRLGLRGRNM